MVTLLVIMILFTAAARICTLSARSNRYSEVHTYASALGHSRMVGLMGSASDSAELKAGWHWDPENPVDYGQDRFYLFWQVDETAQDKKVTFYVAWNDGARPAAEEFGSQASLQESGCAHVAIQGVVP